MTGILKKMRSEYKRSVCIGSIGTAIFLLGLIVFASFPALFRFILDHDLPLRNGSTSFKQWRDIPFPLFVNIYIFNVTNPDDFLRNGSRPILQQLGPYSYRTIWTKDSIVWNSNNTVTFRENHLFLFNQEGSNGTENDTVTMINGPVVIASNIARKKPLWEKVLVSAVLKLLKEKLFIRRTVREFLFDGYSDILTQLARIIDPSIPDMKGKYRWFYGKNNTDDGLFTAYTGTDDMSKFNVITRWNGKPALNFWKGETCNMINGTNGEVNPPIQEKQKHLKFFRTDLCRSWTLTYDHDVKHHGLLAKRFITTKDVIANGTENPANECFTLEEELPSGAYDASTCIYGTPTVMSLPHFYLGDPSYLEAVEGLSPNKSQHDFFLDVEPTSGITIGLTARLQVNFHLRKIPHITIFEDLKVDSLVLPVLWQEIVAAVTEDQAQDLINMMVMPKYYAGIACYTLFALGGVLALAAGIFIVVSWFQIKQELDDDESLIDGDDEPVANGHFRRDNTESPNDDPLLTGT